MGYSLAVKYKNAEELERMNDFYMSNLDIVKELSDAEGRNDSEEYSFLHANERLSYSPNLKNLLGYDGGSGRAYYFELLIAWMAVKSNYKDKTKEPFFYYDHEKVKIHDTKIFYFAVNEKGIPTAELFTQLRKDNKRVEFNLYGVKDFDMYGEKLEFLFNKLEERWCQLNKTNTPKMK